MFFSSGTHSHGERVSWRTEILISRLYLFSLKDRHGTEVPSNFFSWASQLTEYVKSLVKASQVVPPRPKILTVMMMWSRDHQVAWRGTNGVIIQSWKFCSQCAFAYQITLHGNCHVNTVNIEHFLYLIFKCKHRHAIWVIMSHVKSQIFNFQVHVEFQVIYFLSS